LSIDIVDADLEAL